MIRDFQQRPADAPDLVCDVCIVGAGPAGISLALELAPAGLQVCLLESGDEGLPPETQALARGGNVARGIPYQRLDQTRLRMLGGTSAVWEGACIPLDPIDLAERPWLSHSGWPIEASELARGYDRAAALCELRARDHGPEVWGRRGLEPLAFDPASIAPRSWQYSPPTRFGTRYREALETTPGLTVWKHANVVHLQASAAGDRLRHLEVRSLGGSAGRVRARATVLAAGAIENARLLLVSDDVRKEGLGNRHDLVGRTFMEHLYFNVGYLRTPDRDGLRAYFDHQIDSGHHTKTGLQLAESVQRSEQVGNVCGVIDERYAEAHEGPLAARLLARSLARGELPDHLAERAWAVIAELDEVLAAALSRGESRGGAGDGLSILAQAEQVPNLDSRLQLGQQKDALGVRRLELDWRITPLDHRTLQVFGLRLGAELARLGLGRMRVSPMLGSDDEGIWRAGLAWGHHHMGTTRMAAEPERGVVDRDLRVYDLDDLYICSSSVFPTGGFANPTYTIVALASRLARHLAGLLGRPLRD